MNWEERRSVSDPMDPIRRRDELLQVMYWMRGEGLGDSVSPEQVDRLLVDTPRPLLEADLRALCEAGLAERVDGDPAEGERVDDQRYQLTEAGQREGGRRFSEAFADYMKPGHGACSDPACDCHRLGPDACVHAHDG